ncbi:MAG: sortase A [Verrucomicrobiales bacterium]|jgi:sortase A
MTSRILGSIGRLLITTGIVVLLFVSYQLWGTGLQEASAQGELSTDFDELLGSVESTTSTTSTSTTSTSAAPGTTTSTTTTTTIAEAGGAIVIADIELAQRLYREGGEAVARINLPTIDMTKIVVQGVKVEDLRNGPGHYRGTVFPGQRGNSGIAGHRTTYGAPFNRIDELAPGDEIRVSTIQGEHVYRVLPASEAYAPELLGNLGSDFVIPEGDETLGHIIVGPEATWVLGDFGDDRLTLTACHPKFSARQRIIVAAELVTEAVDALRPPPTQTDSTNDSLDLATEDVDGSDEAGEDAPDAEIVSAPSSDDDEPDEISTSDENPGFVGDDVSLDEGLNGDKSALRPAILWGLAAIAVYLAFKELAGRWRRWPAIAIGLAPVVILMGLSFENIDRFLPAG